MNNHYSNNGNENHNGPEVLKETTTTTTTTNENRNDIDATATTTTTTSKTTTANNTMLGPEVFKERTTTTTTTNENHKQKRNDIDATATTTTTTTTTASILKTNNTKSKSKTDNHITFSNCDVRSYTQVAAGEQVFHNLENIGCLYPIQLGWKYNQETSVGIDEYEEIKSGKVRHLPIEERKSIAAATPAASNATYSDGINILAVETVNEDEDEDDDDENYNNTKSKSTIDNNNNNDSNSNNNNNGNSGVGVSVGVGVGGNGTTTTTTSTAAEGYGDGISENTTASNGSTTPSNSFGSSPLSSNNLSEVGIGININACAAVTGSAVPYVPVPSSENCSGKSDWMKEYRNCVNESIYEDTNQQFRETSFKANDTTATNNNNINNVNTSTEETSCASQLMKRRRSNNKNKNNDDVPTIAIDSSSGSENGVAPAVSARVVDSSRGTLSHPDKILYDPRPNRKKKKIEIPKVEPVFDEYNDNNNFKHGDTRTGMYEGQLRDMIFKQTTAIPAGKWYPMPFPPPYKTCHPGKADYNSNNNSTKKRRASFGENDDVWTSSSIRGQSRKKRRGEDGKSVALPIDSEHKENKNEDSFEKRSAKSNSNSIVALESMVPSTAHQQQRKTNSSVNPLSPSGIRHTTVLPTSRSDTDNMECIPRPAPIPCPAPPYNQTKESIENTSAALESTNTTVASVAASTDIVINTATATATAMVSRKNSTTSISSPVSHIDSSSGGTEFVLSPFEDSDEDSDNAAPTASSGGTEFVLSPFEDSDEDSDNATSTAMVSRKNSTTSISSPVSRINLPSGSNEDSNDKGVITAEITHQADEPSGNNGSGDEDSDNATPTAIVSRKNSTTSISSPVSRINLPSGSNEDSNDKGVITTEITHQADEPSGNNGSGEDGKLADSGSSVDKIIEVALATRRPDDHPDSGRVTSSQTSDANRNECARPDSPAPAIDPANVADQRKKYHHLVQVEVEGTSNSKQQVHIPFVDTNVNVVNTSCPAVTSKNNSERPTGNCSKISTTSYLGVNSIPSTENVYQSEKNQTNLTDVNGPSVLDQTSDTVVEGTHTATCGKYDDNYVVRDDGRGGIGEDTFMHNEDSLLAPGPTIAAEESTTRNLDVAGDDDVINGDDNGDDKNNNCIEGGQVPRCYYRHGSDGFVKSSREEIAEKKEKREDILLCKGRLKTIRRFQSFNRYDFIWNDDHTIQLQKLQKLNLLHLLGMFNVEGRARLLNNDLMREALSRLSITQSSIDSLKSNILQKLEEYGEEYIPDDAGLDSSLAAGSIADTSINTAIINTVDTTNNVESIELVGRSGSSGTSDAESNDDLDIQKSKSNVEKGKEQQPREESTAAVPPSRSPGAYTNDDGDDFGSGGDYDDADRDDFVTSKIAISTTPSHTNVNAATATTVEGAGTSGSNEVNEDKITGIVATSANLPRGGNSYPKGLTAKTTLSNFYNNSSESKQPIPMNVNFFSVCITVLINGKKRQVHTTLFICPRTGEPFASGDLRDEDGLNRTEKDGMYFYDSKKKAGNAAAGRALDNIYARKPSSGGELFCNNPTYCTDQVPSIDAFLQKCDDHTMRNKVISLVRNLAAAPSTEGKSTKTPSSNATASKASSKINSTASSLSQDVHDEVSTNNDGGGKMTVEQKRANDDHEQVAGDDTSLIATVQADAENEDQHFGINNDNNLMIDGNINDNQDLVLVDLNGHRPVDDRRPKIRLRGEEFIALQDDESAGSKGIVENKADCIPKAFEHLCTWFADEEKTYPYFCLNHATTTQRRSRSITKNGSVECSSIRGIFSEKLSETARHEGHAIQSDWQRLILDYGLDKEHVSKNRENGQSKFGLLGSTVPLLIILRLAKKKEKGGDTDDKGEIVFNMSHAIVLLPGSGTTCSKLIDPDGKCIEFESSKFADWATQKKTNRKKNRAKDMFDKCLGGDFNCQIRSAFKIKRI